MSEFTCTCPSCLSTLAVDHNTIGFDIECPACTHTFTARQDGYTPEPELPNRQPAPDQSPAPAQIQSEDSTGEPWDNLNITVYCIVSLILPTLGLIAAVIGVCDRAKRKQAGYIFGAIVVGLHINFFFAYYQFESENRKAAERMKKLEREYDAEIKRIQKAYDL